MKIGNIEFGPHLPPLHPGNEGNLEDLGGGYVPSSEIAKRKG